MTDQPTPTWLTVAEVATALRISKMTVYRLLETRELGSYLIGRSYRVTPADLNAYLGQARRGVR